VRTLVKRASRESSKLLETVQHVAVVGGRGHREQFLGVAVAHPKSEHFGAEFLTHYFRGFSRVSAIRVAVGQQEDCPRCAVPCPFQDSLLQKSVLQLFVTERRRWKFVQKCHVTEVLKIIIKIFLKN
jgi:hypothetical protein